MSCNEIYLSGDLSRLRKLSGLSWVKIWVAFIQSALRLRMDDPFTTFEVSSISRCGEITLGCKILKWVSWSWPRLFRQGGTCTNSKFLCSFLLLLVVQLAHTVVAVNVESNARLRIAHRRHVVGLLSCAISDNVLKTLSVGVGTGYCWGVDAPIAVVLSFSCACGRIVFLVAAYGCVGTSSLSECCTSEPRSS